jgi:hypothetical protein
MAVALVTPAVGQYAVDAIAGYGIASRLDYRLTPLLFGAGVRNDERIVGIRECLDEVRTRSARGAKSARTLSWHANAEVRMNEQQVDVARSHLLTLGVAVASALSMALVAADLWAVSLPRHELFARSFATRVIASIASVASDDRQDIGR